MEGFRRVIRRFDLFAKQVVFAKISDQDGVKSAIALFSP